MSHWFYENDRGNPVPYARIHLATCRVFMDGKYLDLELQPHNRWCGPFESFDDAKRAALLSKTNVWGCKLCGTADR